jgi:hypothetical protein
VYYVGEKKKKMMMVFLRRSFFETLWRRGNQMEAGIFSVAVEGVLSSSRHARRKHLDNSGRKTFANGLVLLDQLRSIDWCKTATAPSRHGQCVLEFK